MRVVHNMARRGVCGCACGVLPMCCFAVVCPQLNLIVHLLLPVVHMCVLWSCGLDGPDILRPEVLDRLLSLRVLLSPL